MLRTPRTPAFCASLALHLTLFAALVLLMMHQGGRSPASSPRVRDPETPRMVWLNAKGPGGGGGGGGTRMKEPPRRAERQGRDALTVPAAQPRQPDFTKPAPAEPPALPSLAIPVASLAAATDALPQAGAVDAPPTATLSQGPGEGGGAGTGKGRGDGPERGSGLGDGRDRGTGGGVFQPGNGVTMPIEIQKGTPRYTSEAMRARVQGSIMVECVVETSGACTNIRVRRSFDPSFGLDQEAIKAAAQWRFRPGTRLGQPVPVVVTMEIAFAVR